MRVPELLRIGWDLVVTVCVLVALFCWALCKDVHIWVLRRLGKADRAKQLEAETDEEFRLLACGHNDD